MNGSLSAITLAYSATCAPAYTYLRSREEFEALAKEFGKSSYRYLHVSCHGWKSTFWTTLEPISDVEMADILGPHLKGRRLFVSACLATDSRFAMEVMKNGQCLSVVGPAGSPRFDDATIFWTSFYHLMFKKRRTSMTNDVVEKKHQDLLRADRRAIQVFSLEGRQDRGKNDRCPFSVNRRGPLGIAREGGARQQPGKKAAAGASALARPKAGRGTDCNDETG